MTALILEITRVFFLLRAAGREIGAVGQGGAGTWGFLRSLKIDGPQTVPNLARSRPVTRQYIQTMADELAAEGLIEFIDNPKHRRSRLMRLTKKGEKLYDSIDARVAAVAEAMGRDFDPREIETALDVLRRLDERLVAAPGSLGASR